MENGKYQKRVIYLLTETRDLLKHGVKPTIEIEDDSDELVCCESSIEFESFDTDLLNDKKKYSVVKHLIKRIGGSDYGDHIKKAMSRCLSNKVMSQMNLSGAKSKLSFGNSNVYKIIKEVILLKYQEVSEKDIADKVSAYLKFAPDRAGGGGRKKDKNNNN
ncbi:uncharacterized protein LOC127706809 [Mytilus californianus]|uniref:uncharacterized protein LOC127706809 n=1 Tax=Mytilus californianus TaxID=6549 RepID=UPI002247EEC8|nr:uncharacterized protein LOC127706809 [Mytilus californianus]